MKQFYFGVICNNNICLLKCFGVDVGVDFIGDFLQVCGFICYFDCLEFEEKFLKIVIYNLNLVDNYVFVIVIGNVQDGVILGKIQFGFGWWFFDQKEGMEWQINVFLQFGFFSCFVGMFIDLCSFFSYVCYEYFCCLFCLMIGNDIYVGFILVDCVFVGGMIENICYKNVEVYFGFEVGKF